METVQEVVIILAIASILSNALEYEPYKYKYIKPSKFQMLYDMARNGVPFSPEEAYGLNQRQREIIYNAKIKFDAIQTKDMTAVPIPKKVQHRVNDLQKFINKVATLNGTMLLPETDTAKHLVELADTILFHINNNAFTNLNHETTTFLQRIVAIFKHIDINNIPIDKSILDIKIKSKALKDLIANNYEKSIKLTCIFMIIQIEKILLK